MISGTGVNGVAVHCLLLTQYLLSRGHRVLLLHRPGAWIGDRPGLEGAEKFVTTFGRSPKELIRVTRRLNQFEPDVLHTHMSSAHTYGMLARILSRRPVVATAHSSSLQLHWWFNNFVIATSPDAEQHHITVNRVRRSAMRMIPSFIDTSRFPVIAPEERAAARDTLGIDQGAFVIGCVGDICERKRQIDMVRALAVVLQPRAIGPAAAGRRPLQGLLRRIAAGRRRARRHRQGDRARQPQRRGRAHWQRSTCSRWCRARNRARSPCSKRCRAACR
ncbi:MAG: glycosyltransferase family 4 protein [Rhodopseudomonas palustris]|nr:glycosyltransferase family 4 protein [Rhodopseudomonas palustris]